MPDENLDIMLFIEMDVEDMEDAETVDYSYLDAVFGDDLENPIYADGTDVDIEDIDISSDDDLI